MGDAVAITCRNSIRSIATIITLRHIISSLVVGVIWSIPPLVTKAHIKVRATFIFCDFVVIYAVKGAGGASC